MPSTSFFNTLTWNEKQAISAAALVWPLVLVMLIFDPYFLHPLNYQLLPLRQKHSGKKYFLKKKNISLILSILWNRFHYVRAIFLYINSKIQKKKHISKKKKSVGLCLVFSFSHIAQIWPSFKYRSSGSKKASWGVLFLLLWMNTFYYYVFLLLCFVHSFIPCNGFASSLCTRSHSHVSVAQILSSPMDISA